mmetsp:Transcript_4954/g.3565  ORF Transcript_4954/g.3565 Transcript_4954/m.3565 type:complete len:108 (+) Transcript_4954:1040-1363(+)
MQLNRLKFEQGVAVKVLSEIQLEKVVYPDRFLVENKAESEKLRSTVDALRSKVKYLERCLEEYKNFEQSDYNIHKCLQLVQDFFAKQGQPQHVDGKVEGVQAFLPLN